MADDEKVISLAERRARKKEPPRDSPHQAAEPDRGGGKEAARAAPGPPLAGKLTWLHCPTCGTLQYTEVFMSGGRRHNVCGNPVEEVVVDIDVRAEFTIAAYNLERLKALEEVAAAQRAHYEEYQTRLAAIAGRQPEPYPITAETLARLPVAQVDPMGLLVPDALHQPSRRFQEEEAEASGGKPAETADEAPGAARAQKQTKGPAGGAEEGENRSAEASGPADAPEASEPDPAPCKS